MTLEASPEIWQGSIWTEFLDWVSTETLAELVPDELDFCKTRDGSSSAARAVLADSLEDDYSI